MPNTKVCKDCQKDLPYGFYHKDKSAKTGVRSVCKDCACLKKRLDYKENPQKVLERNSAWRSNNLDFVKAYEKERQKSYYSENREKILEKNKSYIKNNPDRHRKSMRMAAAKRRGVIDKSCPVWLTKEQQEEIKAVYDLARDCEVTSGQKYHVDHIVPLQGNNVCGLHVPWNLQVLPADINMSKGNKL